MDIDKLVRDTGRVKRALKKLPDLSVIALEPLSVHIPKKYVESGLASVTDTVKSMGMFGIVTNDGHYCCFQAQADVVLKPSNIREATIDDVKYIILEFEPGDTVIDSLRIPIDNHINYVFFIEFVRYARLGWYYNDMELSKLFDNTKFITKREVGATPQTFRVLIAIMMRDPDNVERPYRYSEAIKKGIPPIVVGLNNIGMLIEGTFNKLTHGYLKEKTISAILNPQDRVTDTEKIIKGVPLS